MSLIMSITAIQLNSFTAFSLRFGLKGLQELNSSVHLDCTVPSERTVRNKKHHTGKTK